MPSIFSTSDNKHTYTMHVLKLTYRLIHILWCTHTFPSSSTTTTTAADHNDDNEQNQSSKSSCCKVAIVL